MKETRYFCDFCGEEVIPTVKGKDTYIRLFQIRVSPMKDENQTPLIELFKLNPSSNREGQACIKCVEKMPIAKGKFTDHTPRREART